LAVYLHQHPDFAAGVNVAGYRSFAGHPRRLLLHRGGALLTEDDYRLLHVALGLYQGLLAVHHWRSSFLPELFHMCCGNIYCSSAHIGSFLLLNFAWPFVPRRQRTAGSLLAWFWFLVRGHGSSQRHRQL